MTRAYCSTCKKVLTQVLTSFECLSTWVKAEEYYAPGEECKLVKRCPDCETVTDQRGGRVQRVVKKKLEEEDARLPYSRKRLKKLHLAA